MSSEDYSYTNDLEEAPTLSVVAGRHEHNHSPLAQVVAELGGSHANYDYLEESLSTGFANDFEDVQAALALEDFVGVEGSDLDSELFESNSVFDIGAEEPGTRTPSVASQQSVSGTDFDTLPIAPMAKRPIEAPPPLLQPFAPTGTAAAPSTTRRNNATSSNYGNPAANVPSLTPALVSVNDVTKAPATPFKYLDSYGIPGLFAPGNSSTGQPPQHLANSAVKHGRDAYDHTIASKRESGAAGSSVGPYGMGGRGFSKPASSEPARTGRASSSAPAASARTVPPAPPALPYTALPNTMDVEGFGFGIDTFLHGNQLGFGRQPSFKRIAPGAAVPVSSTTSRPYYLLPGVAGEGNGGASLPLAAEASMSANPSAPPPTRPAGAGVGDRNAEAFSTWLEALEPKTNSAASSALSLRGAPASNTNNAGQRGTSAGPSVGADFKREVDVMMKDLLGDYDLIGGMTGVFAPNSVSSGLPASPPPVTNASSASGGRGGSLPPGGKDTVRQLEYDAFLKDVRMLTPTTQSPTAASASAATRDERKKPQPKSAKAAVATVGPNPAFAVEGERRPPPSSTTTTAPKSILSTTAPVSSARATKDSAVASGAVGGTSPASGQKYGRLDPSPLPSQPPDTGGTSSRRRRVWSNSLPTHSSGDGISGAALDPYTEADTAEPPKLAQRRATEPSAVAPKTPSPATGPRPVMPTRAPRTAAALAASATGSGAGATTSDHAARTPMTSPGKPSSPKTAMKRRSPVSKLPAAYEDMDEDLLAGGYMTGAPLLRSTESLSDATSPIKADNRADTRVLASPPRDALRGVSATTSTHGRRYPAIEAPAGVSLQKQKLHSSWKKNGTAVAGKPADPANSVQMAALKAAAPASTSAQEQSAAQGRTGKQPKTATSPAEVSAAPPQHRRTSIPSLTNSQTPLSADMGLQSHPLPLPSFTPNRAFTVDSVHGASANATSPMQRDSMQKGTSVTTMDSVGKASRRASTSPSTVDPIVLGERERSGFLQRVSARSSDSREDAEASTSHTVAAQPRRRLTEFRSGGDAALPPSISRSRISVAVTAEEARAEAAKQPDRERETQQANEERRQRIQAFMAKRKAQKQMEEMRRGQLMERDRQLEAFREEMERQRIHTTATTITTASEAHQQQQRHPQQPDSAVVGSGLNAIKASQRARRPTLERPLRPSVATANFIPNGSTVPMTPEQSHHEPSLFPGGEGAVGAVVSPAPSIRRKRNLSPASTTSASASKAKVRAVVAFICSGDGAAANKGTGKQASGAGASAVGAADSSGSGRRQGTRASAADVVFEGNSVAMEFHEAHHSLRVEQPQERTRYFNVEEYLAINHANACASSKSSDKSGVASSHNTLGSLRNATGAPRRRLISLTLTEMSRKFVAGVNVALMMASTENAQDASVLAIREVVEGVFARMPPQSQLFASVAFVAGGNTEDLLADPPRSARSTFCTSPLFGPTLDDVRYVPVTGVGHLLLTVADAYKRVKVAQPPPEAGLLVLSLLLKQCRDSDVILSSYLISDAGCDAHLYTAILRKSQHTPFALFHSALGGPTLTTVLAAVASEDVATAVPLLNVQHRLSTIANKPCHVGSVRRFMELAQRELDSAIGSVSRDVSTTAGPSEHQGNANATSSRRGSANSLSSTTQSTSNSRLSNAARQQLGAPRPPQYRRLAEQVAMAKRILDRPEDYQPMGEPWSNSEKGASSTMQSMPSTAPPSAALAPRTQLTPKQEEEAKGLLLSAMQQRKTSLTVPAATAAAAAKAGTKAADNGKRASVASPTGLVLPTILPVPPIVKGKTGGRKEVAGPTRGPPTLSVVPLKHPGAAPTQLPSPSPLPPARRSGNYTAASRDGRVAVTSTRNSREGESGTRGGDGVAALLRQSTCNEQSVSASTEYVRRGRVNGDTAAQRNTAFMNFEDPSLSQNLPVPGRGPSTAQQSQSQQQVTLRSRNTTKSGDHAEPPPRPATTALAATFDSGKDAAQESITAARRRASADGGRPSSGLQPFAPPALLGSPAGASAATKRLLPGATTIGSNGPQWPSTPAFEIPTIPSVASIDTSFAHDVSISMRQSSNAYEGERTPIPTSTKVRTLVVVDSRCRETSNVTYDNTMVIATTEDDFEEYDVDEVREATPGQTELIQAELLKELCDTLLMGCNAAILGADSRPTGFSAQVLKSVVHSIFAEMNREGTHRSGRLSASVVKVKGESVVDLLRDASEAQKLVIAISPLFGSCVHGVTYADVSSGAAFNDVVDAALSRAKSHDNGRDYGFLFCSLLFKLRLEEEGDVQVCSLVATFAGENVGLYTSVLDRSPLVPRALFHYALGGPSYTIAMLGIGSEETRANQMLQVQKRLGEMSNRATHPGSVAKFVAGIRNDLTPNLIAKYEHSRDPAERAATKEMIERLAEMVKDADALLVDFDHHQPKAYLHGDAEQQQQQQQQSGVADSHKQAPAPPPTSQQQQQQQSAQERLPPPSVPPISTFDDSSNKTADNVPSNEMSIQTPQSAARSPRPAVAPRALPSIIAVNPEAEGERIQSLVCFEQVMMGAGTVAVQGNSILCASQGGTRFDSDEVITCDENHRSLASKLMDDLVAKFLAGHHTGLLAADSSYSAFTPLMLRHIANSILEAVLGANANSPEEDNGFAFTKPPTISGELQVSIALIKDDVTADLLPIDVDATYHRFEMEHTPLYGPRVVGVTPHLVANPQDFDHFLAVAIDNADPALQTADPGIMVVSLVLTQRVTKPVEDVLVSSLLCTAVFDAVHHYERVLEGNPSEPLDLFKNILHGPCFSVALLGISDEEEDPGKLLRALNDLSQVRNRAPQVNSVTRHIRELQRGIVKLKERMTTSSNGDERAYILSRVEVAEKLLEEAESLQRNPLSLMQPRTFIPLGGTPDLR